MWLRATISSVILSGSAAAQVPPVPIGNSQLEVTQKLIHAFKTKNLEEYENLLSDRVTVVEDGRVLASSKKEWMKAFAKPFRADGVTYKIVSGYSSPGRVLVNEYFNSVASWKQEPPAECCWTNDAVAYDIVGGTIVKIQRLKGGSIKAAVN